MEDLVSTFRVHGIQMCLGVGPKSRYNAFETQCHYRRILRRYVFFDVFTGIFFGHTNVAPKSLTLLKCNSYSYGL